MKNIVIVIVIVAALAGAIYLLQPQRGGESTSRSQLAPDFILQDFDGQEIKLSDFRGSKAVVLNFWASWCPFCLQELPDMAQVQEEFKDDLVVLAVNRAEARETALAYAKEREVTGRLVLLLDPSDSVYKLYGGFGMPVTFFIDKNGVVRSSKQSQVFLDELRARVKDLISS